MTSSLERIDVHAHGFPEAYLRMLCKRYPQKGKLQESGDGKPLIAYWLRSPLPAWDMETRLLVNVTGYDGYPVDISRYTIVKTYFLLEAPFSQVANVSARGSYFFADAEGPREREALQPARGPVQPDRLLPRP